MIRCSERIFTTMLEPQYGQGNASVAFGGSMCAAHEVQVTGSAIDDRLKFAAGVFYFTEEGPDASFSITTR